MPLLIFLPPCFVEFLHGLCIAPYHYPVQTHLDAPRIILHFIIGHLSDNLPWRIGAFHLNFPFAFIIEITFSPMMKYGQINPSKMAEKAKRVYPKRLTPIYPYRVFMRWEEFVW